MNISELIEKLQEVLALNGDLLIDLEVELTSGEEEAGGLDGLYVEEGVLVLFSGLGYEN